jgi:hypothetical protein
MMNRKISISLLSLILVGSLVACATPAIVGSKASDKAPQLIKVTNQVAGADDIVTWDNPFLFGPVPQKLQLAGDIACMRARVDLQAMGYHPKARDLQGNELGGGGYYCYPKNHGDAPHSIPPRLQMMDGVLGWDRPAAFGKVPNDLKQRATSVCERFDKNTIAIAYHPGAQAENGQVIAGGGFLCTRPLNP